MWRKIAELGLTTSYHSDNKIQRLLKIVQFLAYVPVDDVFVLFDKIKAAIDDGSVSSGTLEHSQPSSKLSSKDQQLHRGLAQLVFRHAQ